MHTSLTSGSSQNQKAIKSLLSKVTNGKSTAIERSVVDQCLSLALNRAESKNFFDALFEELDSHCSHQYAVSKLLFLLQSIVNRNDSQINNILKAYMPEIQTITMLTFEDKRPTLRKQIHRNAQCIYESLAFGTTIDEEVVNMATQMTFFKPIKADDDAAHNSKESAPQEERASIAAGVLEWIDNEDDEVPKPKNEEVAQTQEARMQNEEKEEDELGPDPFEDFVGYDPFESLVVPENFSTKFLGIQRQTSASVSNAFF
jgi:hypothetical protein